MTTSSDILRVGLAKAKKSGEVPYQANRHAVRAIDIDADGDAGLDEIGLMLSGLDKFGKDLKELKRAADRIARQPAASVR